MSTLTHGTVTGYDSGGCRCSACREAIRQRSVTRRELAAENGGTYPGAITHGGTAYRNYGCRCSTCVEAQRARIADQRESRHQRTRELGGIAPVVQHNKSTYDNWGCRCRECTADATEFSRNSRAAGRSR